MGVESTLIVAIAPTMNADGTPTEGNRPDGVYCQIVATVEVGNSAEWA